jgi:acetyl esterase/lipase
MFTSRCQICGPIAASLLLFSFVGRCLASSPEIVALWPDDRLTAIPEAEKIVERSKDPAKTDRSVRFVSHPEIAVYLPEGSGGATPAIIICPGGGYGGLAIDKEGNDVARWLNRIGVAGIVLKYRLPRPDLSKDQTPWPLLDAARAIRQVRSRAAAWKIDPAHIGIMGFSAGGHLAAITATRFDAGQPDSADPIERLSSRPDFAVLLYPVVSMQDPLGRGGSRNALLGKNPDSKLEQLYSPELNVTANSPPAFIVAAKDDPAVKVENSIQLSDAMHRAGVRCDLHLYETGGHGFGLGVKGGEVAQWPADCGKWLKAIGVLAR